MSGESWLGNLQMTAVMWWVSEILMRVSQVWGCICWKHRGVFGSVREFSPAQPQDEEGGATVPKVAPSLTDVHKT